MAANGLIGINSATYDAFSSSVRGRPARPRRFWGVPSGASKRAWGGKRAAVAVGHKILVIVYHLLWQRTYYEEQRYAD